MYVQRGLISVIMGCFASAVLGQNCRCGPEDSCWPSKQDWDNLNSTVGGHLVKTVPLGAVCRYSFGNVSYYDATACAKLKASWNLVDPHLLSSSSMMQQLWVNASCDPFDPPSTACLVDGYVLYTINVTQQSDVKAGLRFVQDHNIRLVVRNTGHDDLGRSNGHAALGIWLHYVTGIEYQPEYQSSGYQGPAVKLMAGESSGNLIAKLSEHDMVAVGGACPTVSVAGGHTPGGGHSPLSSLFGMGAVHTLEFEVVTANGSTVTASPTRNQDLYWALSGGGSGNYGIVWSMTIKTFPDMKVALANLDFAIDATHTADDFFEAINVWNSLAPSIAKAGAYSYTYFSPIDANGVFSMHPLFGPNLTVTQIDEILAPLLQKLTILDFPFKYNTSTYTTYYEAYTAAFRPWPVGGLFGSRLIPRDTIEHSGEKLLKTERNIWDMGMTIAHLTFNAHRLIGESPDNAVLPAWRHSDIHLVTGITPGNGAKNYPKMVQQQANITNIVLPALQDLVPVSGAYMNEADAFDPDWKANFFGSNYNRLLQIKRKWDPYNIFWVTAGVGSDAVSENSKQLLYRV